MYDSKLKVSQKADQDYQKLKEGGKSKEIDKAKKQAQHSEQAATKANELYKTALNQLEDGRRNWVHLLPIYYFCFQRCFVGRGL